MTETRKTKVHNSGGTIMRGTRKGWRDVKKKN